VDAIVGIWKPTGWTSFDVVKKIRGYVRPSKVGHAGTLDPFAEGVLVLCIGKMTKKVESLMDCEKEYIATVKLGEQTDTLDIEGKIVKTKAIPDDVNEEKVLSVLEKFIGEIDQIPPMYSALHVNGKRLYELARKGETIERKARKVNVKQIDLLAFNTNEIEIRVICGRGTYVRALARDIARELNTVGFLTSLTRTKVGDYTDANAISIEEFATCSSIEV
jgi:tRNA pseudouridine55 synthase